MQVTATFTFCKLTFMFDFITVHRYGYLELAKIVTLFPK